MTLALSTCFICKGQQDELNGVFEGGHSIVLSFPDAYANIFAGYANYDHIAYDENTVI
jgi:hypothetical protein